MGKAIVLAEKPSAARNFAKALGGRSGTFEGTCYEICALRGHVLELCDPEQQVREELRAKYKDWAIANLPWDHHDIAWKKHLDKDVSKLLHDLKAALEGASECVIATDVDPSGEGELLAWEALDRVGWHGRTTRMYHEDESERSVQRAFRERRPLGSMEEDGDYRKAVARQRWDFMSMQWTRVASDVARAHGFNATVREGRLKSVMTWLVGAQEDAWKSYRKVPYFEARFRDENGVTYAVPQEKAERFAKREDVDLSKLHESGVTEDSRTDKSKAPGRLLDLAGLSAILASEHGSKPAEVLETYQGMYEDQVVSYPRTEDKTITPEQFEEMVPLVDGIAAVVGVNPKLLTHRTPRKGFVKAGGAHGANRPGPKVPASLESLSRYGKSGPWIYETLARNYLAMLAEDYEYTQVRGHVTDFPAFVGSTCVPRRMGFKEVFDSEARGRDQEEDGDKDRGRGLGTVAKPFAYEGCNRRPPRPTMKWLKAKLEKYEVGTGATRTKTLADISGGDKMALLAEKRGTLSLTDCGRVSYTLLDGCSIASPEVTERLFGDMERVGSGELTVDDVLDTVTPMLVEDLRRMQANGDRIAKLGIRAQAPATREPVGRCPRCGGTVYLSTKGKVAFCDSRKSHRDKGTETWVVDEPGCGFKLLCTWGDRRLTPREAGALLKGQSVELKGVKGKSGAKLDLKLALDADSEWGAKASYPGGGDRVVLGRCPRCGKRVLLSPSGAVGWCESERSHRDRDTGKWVVDDPGCGFKLGTSAFGKRMTTPQLKMLLAGEGVHVSGIRGKSGKTFGVTVTLDPDSEWGTRSEFDHDSDGGGRGREHGGAKGGTRQRGARRR
jgi:DNA topoisomerase-3